MFTTIIALGAPVEFSAHAEFTRSQFGLTSDLGNGRPLPVDCIPLCLLNGKDEGTVASLKDQLEQAVATRGLVSFPVHCRSLHLVPDTPSLVFGVEDASESKALSSTLSLLHGVVPLTCGDAIMQEAARLPVFEFREQERGIRARMKERLDRLPTPTPIGGLVDRFVVISGDRYTRVDEIMLPHPASALAA